MRATGGSRGLPLTRQQWETRLANRNILNIRTVSLFKNLKVMWIYLCGSFYIAATIHTYVTVAKHYELTYLILFTNYPVIYRYYPPSPLHK